MLQWSKHWLVCLSVRSILQSSRVSRCPQAFFPNLSEPASLPTRRHGDGCFRCSALHLGRPLVCFALVAGWLIYPKGLAAYPAVPAIHASLEQTKLGKALQVIRFSTAAVNQRQSSPSEEPQRKELSTYLYFAAGSSSSSWLFPGSSCCWLLQGPSNSVS